MSKWSETHTYSDKDFKQTCDYCKCEFRVSNQLQDGHNEPEEYYCPVCNKEYKIRACITPDVELITGRKDGRSNQCNNNHQ